MMQNPVNQYMAVRPANKQTNMFYIRKVKSDFSVHFLMKDTT